MRETKISRSLGLLLTLLVGSALPGTAQEEWRPIGLMRIRDMTPFGIVRLDLLPAHAVPANPGTFAIEANISYQNTYILSENVSRYLDGRRNGDRARLTPEDAEAILAFPDDAYLVDGELGLADLTLHYRVSEHLGVYATLPYYFFDGGFLDGAIESFHHSSGFGTAGRDLVMRDRFQVLAKVGEMRIEFVDEPREDELGDPVFGLRYSRFRAPRTWNLIAEGAAKLAVNSEKRLVSSGRNDYGLQATLQRFFRRQALYASLAVVYFPAPDETFRYADIIPTLILGYELRITGRTNGILQFYASPSVVEESTVEELTEDKYQVTLGLQRWWRNSVWRFGITENVSNFGNTPDIGVSLSVAQVFPGR